MHWPYLGESVILKFWEKRLSFSTDFCMNLWCMDWMHELRMMKAMFDCDSHLAKKLTTCLNDLSLASSLSWMKHWLIPWAYIVLYPTTLSKVVGEHHPQKAWFKVKLSQIWGSNCQGKFVPNLGEILGKEIKWSKQNNIYTLFSVYICHTLISSGDHCLSACDFRLTTSKCLTPIAVESVKFWDVLERNQPRTQK